MAVKTSKSTDTSKTEPDKDLVDLDPCAINWPTSTDELRRIFALLVVAESFDLPLRESILGAEQLIDYIKNGTVPPAKGQTSKISVVQ